MTIYLIPITVGLILMPFALSCSPLRAFALLIELAFFIAGFAALAQLAAIFSHNLP